jgi:hypothetical protein
MDLRPEREDLMQVKSGWRTGVLLVTALFDGRARLHPLVDPRLWVWIMDGMRELDMSRHVMTLTRWPGRNGARRVPPGGGSGA